MKTLTRFQWYVVDQRSRQVVEGPFDDKEAATDFISVAGGEYSPGKTMNILTARLLVGRRSRGSRV